MQNRAGQYQVRAVNQDDPDFATIIDWILGRGSVASLAITPASNRRQNVEAAEPFDAAAPRIDLVTAAYDSGTLRSAAAAIVSPGSAALVLLPRTFHETRHRDAHTLVLRSLVEAARQRSIALLQILVAPVDDAQNAVLERSGFRYLTRLVYLRRLGSGSSSQARRVDDLTWNVFGPGQEALFCRALELSYAQSLDCPELTGLRTTRDVLAGHAATGDHDPALWWVARRSEQVAGVLLLTRLLAENMLEIVYVGVAQSMRGKGVADAMLSRAVDAVERTGAIGLTLAVDARNTPARRLYARWGFTETITRHAWIANPCQT